MADGRLFFNPTGVHSITEARLEEGWRVAGLRKDEVHCPCGKRVGSCPIHGGGHLCAHGSPKKNVHNAKGWVPPKKRTEYYELLIALGHSMFHRPGV
jgi:hypothetical protein